MTDYLLIQRFRWRLGRSKGVTKGAAASESFPSRGDEHVFVSVNFFLVPKVKPWERTLTGKLSFAGGARMPHLLVKTCPAAKRSFSRKGRSQTLSLGARGKKLQQFERVERGQRKLWPIERIER